MTFSEGNQLFIAFLELCNYLLIITYYLIDNGCHLYIIVARVSNGTLLLYCLRFSASCAQRYLHFAATLLLSFQGSPSTSLSAAPVMMGLL